MKLYIWHGVLEDYTGGVAFAMAETEDAARLLICDRVVAEGLYSLKYIASDLTDAPDEVHDAAAAGYCGGGG